jgi:LTXXQ motif family protein
LAVKTRLVAILLAAAAAAVVPILAKSAQDPDPQYAQAAPPSEPGAMPGREGDRERGGWPGRMGERERGGWSMMHRMMMHGGMMRGDPGQRCLDRLAHRAAMRAYVGVKLNLSADQQPLWDKVQSAAQAEEQKERQLCTSLKPGAEPTLLDRMDRMQQFLSARLEGLQTARPAAQALYQALTPEQQAILNHPFERR